MAHSWHHYGIILEPCQPSNSAERVDHGGVHGGEGAIFRASIPLSLAFVHEWHHNGSMDLTPYVDALLQELAVAAEAGGEEARAVAERLTASLESAVRLTLLEALSAAAGEITSELAPGSVDLRLRGREPSFVVTPPPPEGVADEPGASPIGLSTGLTEGDESSMVRINLRLPEDLKGRVEEAARQLGLSVNSWLVRAAAAAIASDARGRDADTRPPRGAERLSGWVR